MQHRNPNGAKQCTAFDSLFRLLCVVQRLQRHLVAGQKLIFCVEIGIILDKLTTL
jgi:hypothetical protein